MQHRIRTTSTATTTAAPVVPMPGRLAVTLHNHDLRIDVPTTIDQVATGNLVTATGTITNIVRLANSRIMLVFASDDQQNAHVLLNADTARMLAPALHAGTRLTVRGLVTRTVPSQPAGIEGLGVRVVTD